MGGPSLHKFQQLSTDTAVSIEKTERTLQRLQSQLDSLAAMVLQNRQALDLLTAGQGGTCLYIKEECCFDYNQSGQVQEDIKGLLEQATDPRFKFNRCMEFSFFPFLALTIHGSNDNYLIRPPIWPLYTPTPYKVSPADSSSSRPN